MTITFTVTLSDLAVKAFAQVEQCLHPQDIADLLRERVEDEIEDVQLHYTPDDPNDEVKTEVNP